MSETGNGQGDGQTETEGWYDETSANANTHRNPLQQPRSADQIRTMATPRTASQSDTFSQPARSLASHAAIAAAGMTTQGSFVWVTRSTNQIRSVLALNSMRSWAVSVAA
jgi:hypothetical protein